MVDACLIWSTRWGNSALASATVRALASPARRALSAASASFLVLASSWLRNAVFASVRAASSELPAGGAAASTPDAFLSFKKCRVLKPGEPIAPLSFPPPIPLSNSSTYQLYHRHVLSYCWPNHTHSGLPSHQALSFST